MQPIGDLVGSVGLKEKIWSYMTQDEVGKIGVWGMGGVGKTTIIKHIHNQILKEDKFDKVIWITVSKEFEVHRLQRNIANAMNKESLLGDDTTSWSSLVFEMLKDKKFVLILDDLWDSISLEYVRIPEPSKTNKSKIVLTTRKYEVCRSMRCNKVEYVNLLREQDACNLFLKKVGFDVFQIPTLESVAKKVLKECGGLPLAIITVASSMCHVYDAHEWKNLCNELVEQNKFGKDDVLVRLKLSYDRLEDLKLKECFLFCSLYPEDWEIPKAELIEYWILEGYVDKRTRQANYDKGYATLNKLESNCLLESTKNGKAMRMHDLIRDMALHIKNPQYMVRAKMHLTVFPNELEFIEDLEKVSLMENSISQISTCETSPKFYKLSTLLLQQNDLLRSISESFFACLPNLRILDLTNTRMERLPDSISELTNLVALILRNCQALKHVPSLAKLKGLKKLDLYHTRLTELPHGMDKLVNLIYLDLNLTYSIQISEGLLPRFPFLQYLCLDILREIPKVRGEELLKLKNLDFVQAQLYNLQSFNSYIRFLKQEERPNSYSLYVGRRKTDIMRNMSMGKCVFLSIQEIFGQEPVLVPADIQELHIVWCSDVRSLKDVPSLQRATDFRVCLISSCVNVECVFDFSSSSDRHCCPQLERLEFLSLSYMGSIKALFMVGGVECKQPLPPAIFQNLKKFEISNCRELKKLFWPSLLNNLLNMEELLVDNCYEMEEIVEEEYEERKMEAIIIFPKLRRMILGAIPKLERICSNKKMKIACDYIQHIEITYAPKLKRFPLNLPQLENGKLAHPPFLEMFYADKKIWESLEWDDSDTKNVLQPFVRYYMDKIMTLEDMIQSTLRGK